MKINAKSLQAKSANLLVESLQKYFVNKLNSVAEIFGNGQRCEAVEWLRDEGRHGGGVRFETRDEKVFNRGSVNISQVHYDDEKTKKLSSATAISCIIHPKNPHAPSMHMHFSWTEMKNGHGYWRLMADLNPSILPSTTEKYIFDTMLAKAAGEIYLEEGLAQGDRYFDIPMLQRTRGVSHFYLEDFNTGNFELDQKYVEQFSQKVVDAYIEIITEALSANPTFTDQEREVQMDYHTLYLFQVLTLDRGTISGLLIHDQNDVGIMGSIPSHVNRDLLTSWIKKMPEPQDKLLQSLLNALPKESPTLVNTEIKKHLANAVRVHYKTYPEALNFQASGNIVPPTVDNHA